MKKFILSLATLALTCTAFAQSFVKVTTDTTDWSGTYLIVYEVDNANALVFDGRIADDLDAKNNCFATTISAGTIAADADLLNATFTIANQGDSAWSCCSHSGLYFGYNTYKYETDGTTISNTLKSGPDNKYPLQLTLEADGTVTITAKCGHVLRYNDDPTHNRFRFHAPGKKKSICLYRLQETQTAIDNVNVNRNELINGALYGLPEGFYIQNGQLIFRR